MTRLRKRVSVLLDRMERDKVGRGMPLRRISTERVTPIWRHNASPDPEKLVTDLYFKKIRIQLDEDWTPNFHINSWRAGTMT